MAEKKRDKPTEGRSGSLGGLTSLETLYRQAEQRDERRRQRRSNAYSPPDQVAGEQRKLWIQLNKELSKTDTRRPLTKKEQYSLIDASSKMSSDAKAALKKEIRYERFILGSSPDEWPL